ncbi:MAG: hypothetical protein GF329_02355 [Candidatus Lokiarchaeota archaeon]|nr:hypothetical protein [Candidatus Lokiarchaeota archaeon]
MWLSYPDAFEAGTANWHIEDVPLEKIDPDSIGLTVDKLRKTMEKMMETGQKLPLVLMEKKDNNTYRLYDGQHRYMAYRNIFPQAKYIKTAVFYE